MSDSSLNRRIGLFRFQFRFRAFCLLLGGFAGITENATHAVEFRNDLGMVTGAYLDRDSGRLILTGNGEHPELSPTESMIATAFQWVFPETPRMPYVSIDPIQEDPEGPFMLIDFDPVSRGTEFGWIMFEADRLMKCLALGNDNIFGLPESSSVPGYRNMFDWAETVKKDREGGPAVWSRFWFHPLAGSVQWDDTAVKILDCRVGVKTEVMILQGGKLISTEGKQDPAAKSFADHFTQNYRAYGEEFPVFLQLEQLSRLMLVSEWLREIREDVQPISLAWVRSVGGPGFDMPVLTPSLRATRETTNTVGNVIETSRRELFGGVDLAVKASRASPDQNFSEWTGGLSRRVSELKDGEVSVIIGNEKGRLLPRFEGPETVRKGDVLLNSRSDGEVFGIEARPNLLSKAELGDGSGRELALPFLPSYRPEGFHGRSSQMGVEGRADTLMETRVYELTGPQGERIGLFDRHQISPLSQDIIVENSRNLESKWALHPDRNNPGIMWATEGGRRKWAFQIESGELMAEFRGERLFHYRYNHRGKIESVEMDAPTGEGKETVFRIGRDHERGPVTAVRSGDDQRITLRSEARQAPGSAPVEFEARNEGRETKQIRYDRAKDAFEMADGSRMADSGLSSIEKNRDAVLRHFSEGGSNLSIIGNDGVTLALAGKNPIVIPVRENEVERQFAKAAGMSREMLADSHLGQFFPEAGAEPTLVSHTSAATRLNAAIVGRKLRENQTIVSTADVPRAKRNLKHIMEMELPEKGEIKVEVLTDTLQGQDQALRELSTTIAQVPGTESSGSSVPVSVLVGHTREGTQEQVLDLCRRDAGSVVLGLFCNTKSTARESQELADSMVAAGAAVAIVPRGLLDSRDVPPLVQEMKQTPFRKGETLLQWVNGILKKLGMEDKFCPETAEVNEGEGRRGGSSGPNSAIT